MVKKIDLQQEQLEKYAEAEIQTAFLSAVLLLFKRKITKRTLKSLRGRNK